MNTPRTAAPQLSIITVNRNDRDGLAKTLASVHEQQSFAACEHLVIDGGSTDGSIDVIRRYADRLAHWVSEPDAGIYAAMNKGIARSRGEFLLFLNSGDWLAPDVLAATFADFPTVDVAYGNLQFMIGDQPGKLWVPPEPADLNFSFWVRGTLPHGATFIRRRLLAERGYDENYRIVADREFFFRTYLRGEATFAHVDRLVSYFPRGGISNDPRHAELRQAELERLFRPHLRPLDLARVCANRTPDEAILDELLRRRHELVRASAPLRRQLRRWIDFFFWLQRHRATRAGLRAAARFLERREEQPRRPL